MYTIYMNIDRNWFITVRTYGTWLPGDHRGFVSYHRPRRGVRVICNTPGTPRDADLPHLAKYCAQISRGAPILLTRAQALALWSQFRETADHRNWFLWAVAVLVNHFHVVVGVPGDPDPNEIRGTFKSYGSRQLNRRWGRPRNGTWWVERGSKRILRTEESLFGAIQYVVAQPCPLLVWTATIPELKLTGGFLEPAP